MRPTVPLLAALLVATPACQMNERVTGTIIGAGGGLLVGGLLGSAVGSTAAGAILGAAAGGAAGYIWGDYLADKRERACAPCATPSPCAAPMAAAPGGDPYPADPYAPYADPYAGGYEAAPAVAGARGSVGDRAAAASVAFEAGRRARTPAEAISHYDAAIRLDPARPEPHNAKGLVYLFQGRRSEARDAFARALAADPSYEAARFNLGKVSGS